MAQQETYYYGQGKLKLAIIAANGTLGPWRWVGDVSALSGAMQEETVSHDESYSGKKVKVREFGIRPQLTMSATLHSLDTENLAMYSQGTASSTAAGTASGEALPTGLQAGDEVVLANPGVSDLVITDSSGTPATLDEEHYLLDPAFGNLQIVSLPTSPAPTQPFIAAYEYAARKQVTLLSAASRPNVALRYEGINLAEGGAPVIMELYKLSPGLLQELSMITDGNTVAGMPVSFSALLDTSKPANGPMGQFGRIIQVG
ncbi:hypothetical protein [Ectopseudomonas oleovorans]|uniref:Uncharacterized protein n=1 Tax=Ectopseudomonas oleovorans (strain CECT 5344) TaxID=1182590 RepID=W6R7M7_ECTO5|nr:hypothetical protein [Pseudomonas oleovorans]CDM42386.1 hypothetical protein BN5_3844 [Pseudomonas oleovorans CECT 5344]CDR93009.1 hypothetical protein PPSAL_3785 [Pseudomonas oleovorans]